MTHKIINYKSITEDGEIDLSPGPFIPKMWDPFIGPLELEETKKKRAAWAISVVSAFFFFFLQTYHSCLILKR